MTRLLPKLLLLMLSAMAAMPGYAEIDIAGYWQHESDPVWIEMRPETGEGVMLRNDNRPDRVGYLVVTDLVAGDDSTEWSAQVFAARLSEYRKAQTTLTDENRMIFTVKVGFMRRSVEWTRVSEVPAEADDG